MSLHTVARRSLAAWAAPDADQDTLRREYLAHLDTHPDATRRECRAGHVTASAAIVDPEGRRTVLTLHRRIGRWLQTGGHCEPGDGSLVAAAMREAAEESGITGLRPLPGPLRLDRHWVPCGGGTWHLDVQYAAVAPPGSAPVRDPAESDALDWFAVDDLPTPSDDACRALVAAAARACLAG